MYLMLKDTPTIYFDENTCRYMNQEVAPFKLRRSLSYMNLMQWLSTRVLPVSRTNAKAVLNYMNLSQVDVFGTVLRVRGLSISDAYWIKLNEEDTWEKLNLFDNPIPKAISELALFGDTAYMNEEDRFSPELTTQGSFAKCWRRINQTNYLYKASLGTGNEVGVEHLVSRIASLLNLPHVEYDLVQYNNMLCSRCANMADVRYSVVPISEFVVYHGVDVYEYVEKYKDKHPYLYQMMLLDGIVYNVDRHDGNWGVLMDNTTGKAINYHRLFDHNMSFKYTSVERNSLVLKNKTLIEAGKLAYEKLGKPAEMQELYYSLVHGSFKDEFISVLGENREYRQLKWRLEQILEIS